MASAGTARAGSLVAVLARLVGPAALTAAGMIGAGAVATRLLAGAWFRFDLLWIALYVVPMVIFTLDSASRVAMFSGGRGMFAMIREDIAPLLAWGVFVPTVAVNVIVNMSQASAMVEGAYGAFGMLPPAAADAGPGFAAVTVALAALTLFAAVGGGYKRVEKVMTALLLVILGSFIVVAIRGLLDWHTWVELGRGLIPRVPPPEPVLGTERVRDGFTQVMAIAGQALPPSVMLAFGYLTTNAGYTAAHIRQSFWRTVSNLGVIWGAFSVVVIVAGATALHAVYTGDGPAFLGVSHYSQIESIPVAGQVLGPALPGALGFLAPRMFSLGLIAAAFTTLISVSLTMTYFCLDMARRNWHFTADNRLFRTVLALWIAVPALVAPFWQLPALLKAILAMVGNLVLAPVAVGIIIYFINRRELGEWRANAGRNLVLAATGVFSLVLVANGVLGLVR
jgi:Mn2+/Fe2+ NRAMP family transporter